MNRKKQRHSGVTVAVLACLILAGCGNGLSKRSLTKLIDAQIDKEMVCWSLKDMAVDFPLRVNTGWGSSPQNSPILKGLVTGGYITMAAGGSDFLGNLTSIAIDLTEKGRSEKVWDPKSGFCVGHRAVDEVKEWTEPAANAAVLATQIHYTWKIVDRPDWATEELFGKMKGMTQPVDDVAYAQKTSEGWQVILE